MLVSSGRLASATASNLPTERVILSRGEAACQSHANWAVVLDRIKASCTVAKKANQPVKGITETAITAAPTKEKELQSFANEEKKLTEAFIDQIHLRIDSPELIKQLIAKIPELTPILQQHLTQLTVIESSSTRLWCRSMIELLVPEEEYSDVGLKEKIFQFAESIMSLTNNRLAVMILEEEDSAQSLGRNNVEGKRGASVATSSNSSVLQQQSHGAVGSPDLTTTIVNIVPLLPQNYEPEDGEVSEDTDKEAFIVPIQHEQPPAQQPPQISVLELMALPSNADAAASSVSNTKTPGIFSRALRQYSTAPPSFVPSFVPAATTSASSSFPSSSSSAASVTRHAYHLLPVPAQMIIVGASTQHDESKLLLNILKQRNPPVIGRSLVKLVEEFAAQGGNLNDFYPHDVSTSI